MGYDAVVVGSGPNGLAAAITCARAGRSVLVLEAAPSPGGGLRSAPLTLPGYSHDVCAAFFPLGLGSPFFSQLPLSNYGLSYIQPSAPVAHPFEDGRATVVYQDVERTAEQLGPDGEAYRRLMEPLVRRWQELLTELTAPLHLPRHPLLLARFGARGLQSAMRLAHTLFQTPEARAVFAGMAAHSMQPLEQPGTGAFGLVLGLLAHAVGWPIVKGGSGKLGEALVAHLEKLGGEIRTNSPVGKFEEIPPGRVVFLDVTPRQALTIMGSRWPESYRRRLQRFRYGPGAFKVDWALAGPIPWRNPACAVAGTVHLGGSFEEIAAAELSIGRGIAPEKPFVLVGQQSLFDASRAPAGKHTGWAYCHVPNGSRVDMRERIEEQMERFAPGFKQLVLARHVMGPQLLEAHNANYVGGDIGGGANTLGQLLARPVLRLNPYSTPAAGVYLCSASTPPGGGVHGMCGYHAACAALRDELK